MNAKKFIANNAREALRKVKESLGNDAVILSNRSIPGGVEILAVAQKEFDNATPSFSAPAPAVGAPQKKKSTFTPSIVSKHISVTDEDDSDYSALIANARRNNF